ncbi:CDP-glycerol glycerophosphotransferase family protein [Siminovitchia sediminis]|uniref:CDP-glycerol glycerophosphotransferase family protein n=1 Tax=Siminovitchia sediminis TaxID=1274353 RepID=A0ABW4KHI3_9BACI
MKLLKEIKKRLVKKVILYHSSLVNDQIELKIHLQNFRSLKKKVDVIFDTREEQHRIPFHLQNNQLAVMLPIELAGKIEQKGILKVFINGQGMWVTEANDFEEKNSDFFIQGKYLSLKVNKNIVLNHHFKQYTFSEKKIECRNFTSGYNSLRLEMNDIPEQDFDIVALKNGKEHVLEKDYSEEDQSVILKDFTALSNGSWRLFLYSEKYMYPLQLKEGDHTLFSTYNHEIITVSNNGYLSLELRPHYFLNSAVLIKRETDGQIQFLTETNMDRDGFHLIVEDTTTHEEYYYQLKKTKNGLECLFPIDVLWKNYSRKRFFVEEGGSEPKKYQFLLNQTELSGTGINFEEAIQSQVVIFSFYIRKDRSLGLKTLRPILKKEITDISDFTISGYLGSMKAFFDCRAYLVFEERESMESIKVPIEQEFTIDLKSLNLVELKSKDKTIIDLYVEVINQEDESIRKEKIKYKYADYKKDNYYDHFEVKDQFQDAHHFLVTTTPFNNLKLETFTIPNEVDIPDNTEVKNDNIWLIGERYDTAQDNGIVLYQWLRENTTIDAYYVIEKDAQDYEKIKDDPHVLTFGSPKHYEIAFKAGVLLGTHDLENILPYKTAKGFFNYEHAYKVFLQHGVLGRKNVEYHKKFYDVPFDTFIVSSDAEKYDIVMDKMGYDADEVAVTGLARFDRLIQAEEPKNILLMPTWRDWINTDQQFLESEYYSTYLNLINNEVLQQLLEQYDVNLNFYPHYRAQDFFQRNVKVHSGRVHFIPFGSRKVQDLLIEHALLITDYSTVSFDFIKMEKPVIHYHFDVKRFFRRGILRPVDETFIGGIAHTEEEMIELIKDRLQHNMKNYEVDISGVIKYHDRKNCERIYQTICNGLKAKRNLNRKIKH